MVHELLEATLLPLLDDLRKRMPLNISRVFEVGEDRVGLIIHAEGRQLLFWDSPISEIAGRVDEIPALIERQPPVPGAQAEASEEEDEEDGDLLRLQIIGESIVHYFL